MKQRKIILLILVAQCVLLGIELLTSYDMMVRQLALALTNIATTGALLLVDRWLRKKGLQLSSVTLVLVASAIWLDALGNFQHMYAGFWWWDRVTHTVGGMALSAGFIDFFLAQHRSKILVASETVAIWLGFFSGQLLGAVYEISEWLGDFWFHTERVRGQYDTSHDLFQNLIGGLVVLLLFWTLRKRRVQRD
jgi:hypothetical protein